jgi:hypothetical protein
MKRDLYTRSIAKVISIIVIVDRVGCFDRLDRQAVAKRDRWRSLPEVIAIKLES